MFDSLAGLALIIVLYMFLGFVPFLRGCPLCGQFLLHFIQLLFPELGGLGLAFRQFRLLLVLDDIVEAHCHLVDLRGGRLFLLIYRGIRG